MLKRRRLTPFCKTGNYSHKKLTTFFFGYFCAWQLSPVAFLSSFCHISSVENYYENCSSCSQVCLLELKSTIFVLTENFDIFHSRIKYFLNWYSFWISIGFGTLVPCSHYAFSTTSVSLLFLGHVLISWGCENITLHDFFQEPKCV